MLPLPQADPVAPIQLNFQDMARRLRASDWSFRLRGQDADEITVILRGDFFVVDFHSGLRIHATDAIEQQDAQTEITLAPALTVSVLMEGTVTAAFDGKRFDHTARDGAAGKMWSLARPTRLTRWTRRGERVCKVNVSVTPTWFTQFDQGEGKAGACRPAFLRSHLAALDWQPGSAAVRMAHDILTAHRTAGMVGRLSLEMNAIGILREAFAACSPVFEAEPPGAQADRAPVPKRDRDRAEAVCHYIDRETARMPTLADIAAATGMSVSTLTRTFKAAYGITVIDYLRSRRLERARHSMMTEDLSIQQAAHAAGYSSAANFATAFKRAFGYSPSQC